MVARCASTWLTPTSKPVTSAEQPNKTQLRVGRLNKAHGLKGALKLELYTDDPDGRFVPGASFTVQVPEASPWHGKSVTVREFRWMNSHPVVFLDDVNDRDAAEALVKAILWVDQDGDAVAVVARSVETKEAEVLPDDAAEPIAGADVESPDTPGDATIDGSGTTPTDPETPEEGEA